APRAVAANTEMPLDRQPTLAKGLLRLVIDQAGVDARTCRRVQLTVTGVLISPDKNEGRFVPRIGDRGGVDGTAPRERASTQTRSITGRKWILCDLNSGVRFLF